jgi:molybdate transport system regulatory protein
MKRPTRRKTSVTASIIRPRIALGPDLAIGPGKMDLLRRVAQTGSISGAARSGGMSYKRAWMLINTLNHGLGRPVVESSTGGRGGGGARLTRFGKSLLQHYEAIEKACQSAAASRLAALDKLLKTRQ